jgi:hypothetical protein
LGSDCGGVREVVAEMMVVCALRRWCAHGSGGIDNVGAAVMVVRVRGGGGGAVVVWAAQLGW